MLINSVVDRARRFLHDKESPYRWETEDLLMMASDGRREIVRVKPESQYTGTEVDTSSPEDYELSTDELGLLDIYVTPLVHFVVSQALTDDSEDADMILSDLHMRKFRDTL